MSNHKETDKDKARAWIVEFFNSNPGASTRQCLKAMNNARMAPFPYLVAEVHNAQLQRRMSAMLVSPSKPTTAGGPQPIVPAHEEEEPMPTPTSTLSETDDLKRAAKTLLEVMRKPATSPTAPPVELSKRAEKRREERLAAARAELAKRLERAIAERSRGVEIVPVDDEVHREGMAFLHEHNISSCILTCSDTDKPRAEWEVEYRARGTGGVDL